MLLSNPHLQGLLESNPELRHALSDPSTLKSILSAATNPAAYNEMLRGHDRALSNLENIPEGFSHLKRVYSTMQEPMYEALTPKYRHRTPPSTDETVRKELTSEPVPNPWAPMSLTDQDGLGLGFPLFHTASGAASGSGAASAFASGSGSASIASSAPLLQRPAAGLTPSSPRGSLKRKLPASSASASSLDASPEEDYSAQLETLHGLGFLDDDGENRPALEVAKGNLSAAIDWIMKHRQK